MKKSFKQIGIVIILLFSAWLLSGCSSEKEVSVDRTINQQPEVTNTVYENGISALKEQNYIEAINMLSQVGSEDERYAEAKAGLQIAKTERAKQLVNEGKNKFSNEDYFSALTSFNDAAKLAPDLPEVQSLKQQAQEKYDVQQKKLAAERAANELAEAKKKMKEYEIGTGVVGIAITEVKASTRVNGDFGQYYYVNDPQNDQFVWVYINAANGGIDTVHVNPNDFTLSTEEGYTANYDQASFNVKYFDATNLAPNNYTSGWLIFLMPKGKVYTLHYSGFGGSVNKTIVF